MNCFTMNLAGRFNINTEAELAGHNLDVLYECHQNKEKRYRIRHGILNGQKVVVIHIVKSRWDKFMSYLPSCCSLRERFITQLSFYVRNNRRLHNKLDYIQRHDIKVPFLSDSKLRSLLAHKYI